MRIARHCLRVLDRAELVAFYTGMLGMRAFGPAEASLFGYDPRQCLLEFRDGAVGAYTAANDNFYWKIGITLPDLDAAVAYLRQQGWSVADPYQFRDIGYLSHLRDPQGFVIELLQQGFEGKERSSEAGHPVGGKATLAHISLRVTDIAAARAYCEGRLGMRLMSRQPVHDRGFCLYFYGWSDEALPDPDLEAVANREWLWSRPYALVELQHLETPGARVRKPDDRAAGFAGIAYGSQEAGALECETFMGLAPAR